MQPIPKELRYPNNYVAKQSFDAYSKFMNQNMLRKLRVLNTNEAPEIATCMSVYCWKKVCVYCWWAPTQPDGNE